MLLKRRTDHVMQQTAGPPKIRLGVLAFTIFFALFLFLSSSGSALALNLENEYTVTIHDHNTGELLSQVIFYRVIDNENIPIPGSGYGWDGGANLLEFNTTSKVLNLELDKTNMQVFVQVEGEENTPGEFSLFWSTRFVHLFPENVKVYLDNQPIKFTIETYENVDAYGNYIRYFIRAEYTHSSHLLTFDLGTSATGGTSTGVPIWSVAVVGLVAVVIALGAVYWLKFRR